MMFRNCESQQQGATMGDMMTMAAPAAAAPSSGQERETGLPESLLPKKPAAKKRQRERSRRKQQPEPAKRAATKKPAKKAAAREAIKQPSQTEGQPKGSSLKIAG